MSESYALFGVSNNFSSPTPNKDRSKRVEEVFLLNPIDHSIVDIAQFTFDFMATQKSIVGQLLQS